MKPFTNVVLVIVLAFIGGCASRTDVTWKKGALLATNAVHLVDYSTTPQMKDLAERARRIGDEYYPKVVDLLVEDGTRIPQHFDIVFKKRLKASSIGANAVTAGCTKPWWTTIYLNAGVWAKPTNYLGTTADPVTFKATLIHEMAHITRRYPLRTELLYDMTRVLEGHPRRLHDYWEEGIADYAIFKLGFTNSFFCPKCSAISPDYYSGYNCAGAFLLYLDSIYGPDLIRRLRTQLSLRSYNDTFFSRYTGESLASLWSDFQKTPAFTPAAARVAELRQALGYADGELPKNFADRFDAYVRHQPFGYEINDLLRAAERAGEPIKDPRILTQMDAYFSEPGGTAFSLLERLFENHKLPGVSKTEYGTWDSSFLSESPEAYPAVQTLRFRKLGTTVICNYTVRRESEATRWKLQKAWGTDDHGNTLHEYPFIDSELQRPADSNLAAARIKELQRSIGFKDGQPPSDFADLFEVYALVQPWGKDAIAWLRSARRAGQPIDDPDMLIRMFAYYSEPGGSAVSFLSGLRKSGKLPGISKADRGTTDPSFLDDVPEAYPTVQTLHFSKKGDTSLYNYTVRRTTEGAPWKLQRAWRTDVREKLLEEYPIGSLK